MLPDRDHPDWTRHRGDPIPREELQRIDDQAAGTASVWPTDADVLAVRAAGTASGTTDRRGFWARIISLDATSPARYSFQQVVGDVEDPRNRFDQPGGVGPGAVAYEQGDNPTVPVGTVVWMERGGPAYYEFAYQPPPSSWPPGWVVVFGSGSWTWGGGSSVHYIGTSGDDYSLTLNQYGLVVLDGPPVHIDQSSIWTVATGQTWTITGPGALTISTASLALPAGTTVGGNAVVTETGATPARVPVWDATVPNLVNSPIYIGTTNNVGINVVPNVLYSLDVGGDIRTTSGNIWLSASGEILAPTNEIRLKVTTGNHLTLSLPDIDKYSLLSNDTNDAVYAVTRPGGIKPGVDVTVAGLDFFGGLMAGGTLSVPTSALSGALPAANFPALTGDVTTAAGALATTIVAAAVTYAKLQNVSATARVLGRKTAGAGSVEECTLSDVLDFVGSAAQGDVFYRGATTWTRLGAGTSGLFLQTQGAGANPQWATPATGSGTVTSVGASGPAGIVSWSSAVTTSGTLTATLVSQTASTFLAGPASGGAAAPTFRTIAALDLPVMGAAGAAHAAGAVPDPGATAHTNIPHVLGDTGAFVKPLGRLLGSSYVSTDQTTTSTSYVDLATADSVTFTLDVTSDVLVLFLCETYSTVANDTTNSIVTLDGTDQTGTGTQTTIPTASGPQPGYATAKLTSLAAGSHTIKIRHRLQSGGTGTAHFLCRSLSVFLAG